MFQLPSLGPDLMRQVPFSFFLVCFNLYFFGLVYSTLCPMSRVDHILFGKHTRISMFLAQVKT